MSGAEPQGNDTRSEIDWLCCMAALDGNAGALASYLRRGGRLQASPINNILVIVAERGYFDVVRILLDAGIDVNMAFPESGMTALMQAAQHGHLAIAKLLVLHGANKHASTSNGINALMLAASNGRTEIVEFLLRIGVDYNARSTVGETALMYAARRGHLKVVETLVEAGADKTIVSDRGLRALQYAIQCDQQAIVARLR